MRLGDSEFGACYAAGMTAAHEAVKRRNLVPSNTDYNSVFDGAFDRAFIARRQELVPDYVELDSVAELIAAAATPEAAAELRRYYGRK